MWPRIHQQFTYKSSTFVLCKYFLKISLKKMFPQKKNIFSLLRHLTGVTR